MDTAIDANGREWDIHGDGTCRGEHCPWHQPSDHQYRDWPWLFMGKHVVRVGQGEVVLDPDDYEYHRTGHAVLYNRGKCRLCDTVIQSYTRHDFRECACGASFVDGGQEYLRRGGQTMELSWVV